MKYIETEDLAEDQGLSDVQAILNLEYFQKYETWHVGNKIESNLIEVSSLGNTGPRGEKPSTVKNMLGYLNPLIDQLRKDPNSHLEGLNITLHASDKIKHEVGFVQEEIDNEFAMWISFSLKESKEKYAHYILKISHSELEGKEYDKWIKDVDTELLKVLSYMPVFSNSNRYE